VPQMQAKKDTMKKKDAVAILQSLHCMGCEREPKPEEVTEMYTSFGHQLVRGDKSRLRWRCLRCKQEGPQ
jgi:hypothetical protein